MSRFSHSPARFAGLPRRCGAAFLGLWLLGGGLAGAVDYYVSPTGNDNASGSALAPWRTLQRAANAIAPGVTIKVRTGVYREQVGFFAKAGSLASPAVFEAAAGESPVIDGSTLTVTSNASALVEFYQCSHLVFRGFEIRNFSTSTQSITPSGIYLSGTCANLTIEDNLIHSIATNHNNGNAHGIACYGDTTGGVTQLTIRRNELRDLVLGNSEAMVLNGNVSGFLISENHVHHCNNIGIDLIGYEGTIGNAALDRARNGTVSDNLVHDIDTIANPAYGGGRSAAGIYVDGGADIVIERNRVHRCNIGIEIASEHAGRAASRIRVRDNVLWLNHMGGIFTGGYDTNRGYVEDCSFTHNTLWRNDTDATYSGEIVLQHDVRNSVFTHNLIVAGAQSLMIGNAFTVNTGNVFDYNLYCHPAGQAGAKFYWRNVNYNPGANVPDELDGGLFFQVAVESQAGLTDPVGSENFALLPGAYPIDRGDPGFVAASGETDAAGNARVVNGRVDLGAYEFAVAPPGAPTGFDYQRNTPQTTVPMSWAMSGADHTGFEIQRAAGTGAFSTLVNLPADARQHVDATGQPGSVYRYRIRALRDGTPSAFSAEISATISAPAAIASGAAFTGLFAPAATDDDLRGLLAFQVDARLRLTGVLIHGLRRYNLSGQCDTAGRVTLPPIARTGLDPLVVTLEIDFSDADLPVTGSVEAGALDSPVVGGAVAGVPNPHAGLFTLGLEPTAGSGLPQASGYGHLSVPAKGLAVFSLQLPDGRAIKQSGAVTRDGRFFVCGRPYPAGGWLSGVVTLGNDGTNDAHGPFHWHKAGNAAEALYPGGFTGQAPLVGSRHATPVVGERLLTVANAADNALALFGPADIDPAPGDSLFTLDAASRALFPGASGIVMATRAANGLFGGSFLDFSGPKAIRRPFGGVFLRRQNRAVGYYPGSDAAGRVTLMPAQPGRIAIAQHDTIRGTVANGLSFFPLVTNGPASEWGLSGALPPGLSWNAGTRLLTGTPQAAGTWWITIWARDASGNRTSRRLAIVVDTLFTKTAGVYWGLGTEPVADHATRALLSLTLAPSGAYSGVLVLGGVRQGFRGVFDPLTGDGGALTLARRGTTPLTLELDMDQPGVGDSLSGTLKADASLLTPAVDATVRLERVPWSRTNPAPQAGRYPFVLPAVALSGLPQAHGYGIMTIAVTGAVSVSGVAGNGTPFAAASGLSAAGEMPLLALLNRGAGSLSGWLQHRDLAGSDVDGPLHWEAGAAIDGTVGLEACLHVRPAVGDRVLNLANGSDNARMTFGDGLFTPEPYDWVFTLEPSHLVAPRATPPMSLRIDPVNGFYSGAFQTVVNGRPAIIRHAGVILRKANRAYGQYPGPAGERASVEWGAN